MKITRTAIREVSEANQNREHVSPAVIKEAARWGPPSFEAAAAWLRRGAHRGGEGEKSFLEGAGNMARAIAYRAVPCVCQKKNRLKCPRPFASYQDFSDGLGRRKKPSFFRRPSQSKDLKENKRKLTPPGNTR